MNKVITYIEPNEIDSLCPFSQKSAIDRDKNLHSYFEKWSNKGPACIVANNPFDAKEVFEFISSYGMEALPLGSSIFEKFYPRFIDLNCGLIIMCIDDFSSLGRTIQKLRDFREERPDVPVLLMSANFISDDITQERLAICDVSLHIPINSSNIEEYFSSAWMNNDAWKRRLIGLEYEKLMASSAEAV